MKSPHVFPTLFGFTARFSAIVLVIVASVSSLGAEEQTRGDDGIDDLLNSETMEAFGEYARSLTRLLQKSGDHHGLTVDISIVPDGYRYKMAEEFKELGAAGYEGKELWREIVKAHKKHAKLKKKLFASIKLKARGDTYFFIEKGKKFLYLKGRTSKPFSVLRTSDKITYERWQVFMNAKGKRAVFKKILGRIDNLKIQATTGAIKLVKKEPFTWRLNNIIRQAKSDGLNSVNPAQRQIGCINWKDLYLSETSVKFYPGRWKIPDPPEGFDRLLKKLAKTP